MKSNVPVAQAINDEAALSERVQEALGQLADAGRAPVVSAALTLIAAEINVVPAGLEL